TRSRSDRASAAGGLPVTCHAARCLPVPSIQISDLSRAFGSGGLSGELALVRLGLNLVFLVPGEMSGPETYARELIPALLNERPDLRITAFINREATEEGRGPWRALVPAVT